jgi:hypothetical protein
MQGVHVGQVNAPTPVNLESGALVRGADVPDSVILGDDEAVLFNELLVTSTGVSH